MMCNAETLLTLTEEADTPLVLCALKEITSMPAFFHDTKVHLAKVALNIGLCVHKTNNHENKHVLFALSG